ncbi:MAG: capsular polysaccharide biosynthesis protein, partial [Candidatus Peregrinibacteria bacterium Greene0416_62]
AFANQELMVQLVAAHIPPGVCIYIKEHPAQGELFRSEAFYRSIRELPCVRFVPRSADSLRLIHNAKAIATITGTAGFEAIFRGKPVLMFGHRFCQYAPGTYMIRSTADCRNAMERIFQKGETQSPREVRLFLKAIEETTVPFEGGQLRPDQASREERARVMGEMVSRILEPLFR